MITKSGLCLNIKDGKNILSYNGKYIIASIDDAINKDGLYMDGVKLFMDGIGIAMASSEPKFEEKDGDLFFGDVNLSIEGKVVNITNTDYSTLLGGELVAGYKKYDRSQIYNIVDDVQSADTITYTVSNGVITFSTSKTTNVDDDIIYGNVADTLQDNTENLTTTVTNASCPVLTVKRFNPIVPVGGSIELEYFVDTHTMSSLNYDTIDNTFTVIIITASGGISKRTTYGGRFKLSTPTFANSGETWFSIRCIDSNGVGSPTWYYNVLVRNEVTPNYYEMQDSDLEEFGIVPNDNDVQIAYDNKAALSNFFADVKENGYNGVVMLNNIYWIDFHATFGTQTFYKCTIVDTTITKVEEITFQQAKNSGENIRGTNYAPTVGQKPKKNDTDYFDDGFIYYVRNTSTSGNNIAFPDEFTVDLNGSTIKAVQFDDLVSGQVLMLSDNFDVHIKNGIVAGCYEGFDFDTAKVKTGNTGEHISVCSMNASKYCSFENLDVSGSLGYDGGISSLNLNIGTELQFTDGKRIDLATGAVVDAQNMVITQAINVNPNHSVGVIAFGRGGYCGYRNAGTHREIFASFYTANNTYISSIKSRLYEQIVIPANAEYVIMTGYGKVYDSELDDKNDIDWKTSTSNGKLLMFNPKYSIGNIYKNCTWHDTRTTAITNPQALNTLIDGCSFTNIAKEKSVENEGYGAITPLLGDLEDSWQWGRDWCLKDCTCTQGKGSSNIVIHYIKNADIINCDGISFSDNGGMESGFIEDSDIPSLTIYRNRSCYHPFVIYNGNTINKLDIRYGKYGTKDVVFNLWTTEKRIAMTDTILKEQCGYSDLNLRNSMNGDVWND